MGLALRNWFKGNDTVSILKFLQHRLQQAVSELPLDSQPFFQQMFAAVSGANRFLSCLYGTYFWLSPLERESLIESGHAAVKAFQQCAQVSYRLGVTRWKYQTKLHMLGEVLHQLEKEKRANLPSVSPLAFGTQQDEDFVGRVSALSRSVAVKRVHDRTLNRYKIALAGVW